MVSSALPLPRFGRLQSVADLRALALRGGPATPGRIAALIPGLPPPGVLAAAAAEGRLSGRAAEFQDALALAATLPGQDPDAFVAATALLLADRLQDGAGRDDLYWHHDAHAETYRGLAAPDRAAIFTAFALLHRSGRVTLPAPPPPQDCATRAETAVRAVLDAEGDLAPARVLAEALETGRMEEVEALWRAAAEKLTRHAALRDAVRHLHQTRPGFDPYRDWDARQVAAEGIALPPESA
jgi:hypothetical protein